MSVIVPCGSTAYASVNLARLVGQLGLRRQTARWRWPVRAHQRPSLSRLSDARSLDQIVRAAVLDEGAAQVGGADDALERASGVRGHRVAVPQRARVDDERRRPARTRRGRRRSRRSIGPCLRHPSDSAVLVAIQRDHLLEREAALARLGPDDREAHLQRRDATPGREEVAAVEELHAGMRRRVVGHDDVDTPSASACQSSSWLAASRTGGQHLYWVWPSATSSAVEWRGSAGRSRPRSAGPRRGPRRSAGTDAALDRCTMCTRQPVRRAASITCSIATSSVAVGRDGRGSRRSAARGRPANRCDRAGVLGMHDQQPVELGDLGHRRVDLVAEQRRELRHPGVEQEALEAEDAGVVQRAQVAEVARHRAAPEADVDEALAVRRCPASAPAPPRSTVAGIELSGMSRIVVTPPAAAAAVAVAKPSHSVRPGSLTCTWVSTMPGMQHLVGAQVDGLCPRAATRAARSRPRPRRGRRCSGDLTGADEHPAPAEHQVEGGHGQPP